MLTSNSKTKNESGAENSGKSELAQSKLCQWPESNPLRERENFAISLRKNRKRDLLAERRKKTYGKITDSTL